MINGKGSSSETNAPAASRVRARSAWLRSRWIQGRSCGGRPWSRRPRGRGFEDRLEKLGLGRGHVRFLLLVADHVQGLTEVNLEVSFFCRDVLCIGCQWL